MNIYHVTAKFLEPQVGVFRVDGIDEASATEKVTNILKDNGIDDVTVMDVTFISTLEEFELEEAKNNSTLN